MLELREGRLDTLLATLKAHAGQRTKAAECEAYIETIRERMRYADFLAQGLQIGSGIVEAGCKTVVAVRLKQASMYWIKDGAEGILGGRYEDFWVWRSESQHAAAAWPQQARSSLCSTPADRSALGPNHPQRRPVHRPGPLASGPRTPQKTGKSQNRVVPPNAITRLADRSNRSRSGPCANRCQGEVGVRSSVHSV